MRLSRLNYESRLQADKDNRVIFVSPGNTKLGNIPSFNLSPIVSCQGSTPLCRKYCYARSSAARGLSAKKAWACNLWVAESHLSEAEEYLDCYLTMNKTLVLFRIHSSGDFISQEYLDMWFRLARKHSGVKFLAFTKCFDLDYSQKPSNFALIWSIFPDTPQTLSPQYKPYARAYTVFPDSMPDKQYGRDIRAYIDNQNYVIPCGGACQECGVCWHIDSIDKSVRFNVHGSAFRNSKF